MTPLTCLVLCASAATGTCGTTCLAPSGALVLPPRPVSPEIHFHMCPFWKSGPRGAAIQMPEFARLQTVADDLGTAILVQAATVRLCALTIECAGWDLPGICAWLCATHTGH